MPIGSTGIQETGMWKISLYDILMVVD